MMRRVLAVVVMLGLAAGVTVACPPRGRVFYKQAVVVKEVVVVKKDVIVAPVAVFTPLITVPAYGASYVPPLVPPPYQQPYQPPQHPPAYGAPNGANAALDAILRRLDAIEGKVPAGPKPDGGEPQSKAPKAPVAPGGLAAQAVELLNNKCASCHTGPRSRGSKERGPFVIFAEPGKLNPGVSKGRVYYVAYAKTMPLGADGKPAPLTDEEVGLLTEWLNE